MTDKCATHEHPEPTANQRARMHTALKAAMTTVDEAFTFANRTPAYHHLAETLGAAAIALMHAEKNS